MTLILDTLKRKMRKYKDNKTVFLKKILKNIDYLSNISDDVICSMVYQLKEEKLTPNQKYLSPDQQLPGLIIVTEGTM